MRIWPPFLILVVVGLLGIAWAPLRQFTAGEGQADKTELSAPEPKPENLPGSGAKEIAVFATVKVSEPLKSLKVRNGEMVLWQEGETGDELIIESDFSLVIPGDGLELVVDAIFQLDGKTKPQGSQRALQLILEPDAMEARSQTAWTEQKLQNEVMTFQWPRD